MKNHFLLFGLFLCLCGNAQTDTINKYVPRAEKSWYLGLTAGYGHAAGKQMLNITAQTHLWYSPNEYRFGSLAQGFQAGIKGGYQFKNRLAVECGLYLFRSNVVNYKYEWTRDFFMIEGDAESEQRLIMPRLFVGMAVPIYETQKWNWLLSGGITLARPVVRENVDMYYYTSPTQIGEQTVELYGNLSAGFYLSLQSNYNLGKHWFVQAELLAIGQSWAPAKRSLTRYELNGTNQLPGLDTWQKEIVYTQEVPASQSNPDEPFQMESVRFMMNTVGLQLGVYRRF
ncbi:MAG: hypothetical protein MUC87_06165 [Bacteroidia bacterium]|jgi:hypothetical protein|nr:hypothetical protein [Bacteroidia bacterium]